MPKVTKSAPKPKISQKASRKDKSTNGSNGSDNEQFRYRALEYSPGGPSLPSVIYSADHDFLGQKRQLAWNTTNDVYQNMTLVSHMTRVHLAFTSSFEFMPRTNDPVYNRELKLWFRERTEKESIDVQRRFSLDEMFFAYETGKVLDGFAPILLVDGGRLQLLEAFNIAKAKGCPDEWNGRKVNENGLVLDEFGAIDFFAIATGDSSATLVHRTIVPWTQVVIDGYSERAADTLWESPLLAALNSARDLSSANEFYLAKCKAIAMFGLAWFRNSQAKGSYDFPTNVAQTGNNSGDIAGGGSGRFVPPPSPQIQIKQGMFLQGEQGDEIKVIESGTPPREFREYAKTTSAAILQALDIPYTFIDSEAASWSSMKADANRYKISCDRQRRKNQAALKKITRHIFRGGIADGSMPVHPDYNADNLPFTWTPRGVFLLDATKEIPAIMDQVSACWKTNSEACAELGTGDFEDKVEKIAEENAFMKAKGVQQLLGVSGRIPDVSGGTEPGQPGQTPTKGNP